jgi:hypothetical protein
MRMNIRTSVALASFVLAASASCKKSTPSRATHVPGTPHTDEVVAAWRNSGLAPEGFAPLEPAPNGASYCEHGTVAGVDTLVCEYASDDAVAKGIQLVKEGWARVDAHTGVVLRAKRTTMSVVDRERREPSGKTIVAMVRAFRTLQ